MLMFKCPLTLSYQGENYICIMGFLKMLVKRMLFLMVIYQLCRLLFWLFNRELLPDLASHDLILILFGSIRFDSSILMYLNGVYIVMFILPFNFRYNRIYQKVAKIIFIITNGVGILANLIDCSYFPLPCTEPMLLSSLNSKTTRTCSSASASTLRLIGS